MNGCPESVALNYLGILARAAAYWGSPEGLRSDTNAANNAWLKDAILQWLEVAEKLHCQRFQGKKAPGALSPCQLVHLLWDEACQWL